MLHKDASDSESVAVRRFIQSRSLSSYEKPTKLVFENVEEKVTAVIDRRLALRTGGGRLVDHPRTEKHLQHPEMQK